MEKGAQGQMAARIQGAMHHVREPDQEHTQANKRCETKRGRTQQPDDINEHIEKKCQAQEEGDIWFKVCGYTSHRSLVGVDGCLHA